MARAHDGIALLTVLLALGCAPGGARPEPDGGAPIAHDAGATLAVDAYFDEFFTHLCGWLVRCEPKIGALALGETLCHPVRTAETRARFAALLESGEARFDATIAEGCLDALRTAECNAAALDLERCDAAFVGRVAPGEACDRELGCADGTCVFGASCPGTCVVTREGEPCTRAAECEGELGCVEGRCAPRRREGEACARRTDCVTPLTCGLDGRCAAPPSTGEPCRITAGGDLCGGDLVCAELDAGARACAAGATAGQACSSSAPCAPGGRCVEGTCVATAGPGGACADAAGCIALHACVEGVCRPMPSATQGGACSDAEPCVEGACVEGACVLLRAGEACETEVQFGECEGRCTDGTCSGTRGEPAACDLRAG